MKNELDGYVIYCNDSEIETPLGVVSDSYDCKAISDYIPRRLKNYLVEIEDKRFFQHNGVDFKGISRAFIENIKAGSIVQGGSTISQQLARNLLRDNRKTITRKIKETFKAVQIEKQYSKEEILNLYFNNIYFGKNIWGLRAAGLFYFGKEVEILTQSELLYLLTILRGPNYYSKRPELVSKRYKTVNNILYEKNLISKNRFQKNIKSKLVFTNTQLTNIKNASIPFISNHIDTKRKIIKTSIDLKIQEFSKKFVSESKYPVSIIAIRKGSVVGFASSYGSDYPFISKSNVGSTLKPFLYCHLRNSGVSKKEKFESYKNELSWEVREVGYYKAQLNIEEALLYSNNNAFLNAASMIGIESSLQFLADTFNKSESDFFPSSILGATKSGISLYELALTYSNYFNFNNLTDIKIECLTILNKILYEKLDVRIENAFLKTGTTNDNKERYVILGNTDLTYAVLRNENKINDKTKEGGFMNQISRNIFSMLKPKTNFVWM